jgi:hypothetical protein
MKYTALLVFVGITSFLAGGVVGVSVAHVETPTEEYNRGFRFGYETGLHDATVEKAKESRLPCGGASCPPVKYKWVNR